MLPHNTAAKIQMLKSEYQKNFIMSDGAQKGPYDPKMDQFPSYFQEANSHKKWTGTWYDLRKNIQRESLDPIHQEENFNMFMLWSIYFTI